MRCKRRTLGIRLQGRVSNTTMTEAIGLPLVSDIIDTRRSALFGHMVRLGEQTPAHRALKLAVCAHHGCPPSTSWRQPRGRARDTWLQPLMHSGTSTQSQWDSAVQRGHRFRRNISCQTRDYDDDDDNER